LEQPNTVAARCEPRLGALKWAFVSETYTFTEVLHLEEIKPRQEADGVVF
jgi:hypothetical protein